ncbi:MAG: cell division protein ZapA [Chitinivibrionales bacterium]|nr:cell division protein ZapA [Chitinivibrionales bacterium]MBD3394317.1 cell division protein ZapA [Chitinivibrionales bacterium]
MDAGADSVRVYICGDEYSIKGDVDIETTKQVAEYVDRKMMEFQKNITSRDKLKVAVLSALNIAGELFEQKRQRESAAKKLEELHEKSSEIGTKIDSCLG